MGKGKGIFKRIAAGALSFTMLCGMVTPAFAAEKNGVEHVDAKQRIAYLDEKINGLEDNKTILEEILATKADKTNVDTDDADAAKIFKNWKTFPLNKESKWVYENGYVTSKANEDWETGFIDKSKGNVADVSLDGVLEVQEYCQPMGYIIRMKPQEKDKKRYNCYMLWVSGWTGYDGKNIYGMDGNNKKVSEPKRSIALFKIEGMYFDSADWNKVTDTSGFLCAPICQKMYNGKKVYGDWSGSELLGMPDGVEIKDGTVMVNKLDSKVRTTILAHAEVDMPNAVWGNGKPWHNGAPSGAGKFRLKLDAKGDTFTASIDNKEVFKVKDNSFEDGYYGFFETSHINPKFYSIKAELTSYERFEKERAELKEQIKSVEEEIRDLTLERNALAELDKNVDILEKRIEEANAEKERLEDKLKDEQVANAKDKAELNKKIEELEDKLTEAEKDKKSAIDELEKKDKELSDKIADLNKKTSDLENEKNKLEKELADSKDKSEADKQELNEKIKELDKKIKDQEAERKASEEEQKKINKDLQDKIADLNKNTSELEKAKTDLEKKLETDKSKLQSEIDKLDKEIKDLTKERTEAEKKLEQKIKDLEADLAKEKEEREKDKEQAAKDKAELNGKIEDLNKKIAELDKDKAELDKALANEKAESKAEREALKEEIAKLNEKLDAEIAEREALKKELADEKKYSESERKQLAERIVKLENDVYELNQAKEKLEKNLETLNADMNSKIEELQNKITKLSEEKAAMEKDLRDEIAALKDEIKDLNEVKDQVIKDLEDHKNKSQEEKDKLNKEIGKLDGKISDLKDEKNKLEETDKKQKEKIDDLEKALDDLREEFESERDRNELNDMNLPKDVRIGQWYPERVIEYPSKRRYDDGDTIKLDGMKMEFRRVIKENGHYKAETVEVSYDDMKQGYKGWNLNLKTKTAKYDASTNGKMKIRFTMKLAEAEESMK